MGVVLRSLRLDELPFQEKALCQKHEEAFTVILHEKSSPYLITSSRTARWDSEPQAPRLILEKAEEAKCRSLCMTHFAFILGKFPKMAFTHCLRMASQNWGHSSLQTVVLNVDSRYLSIAERLHEEVKQQVAYADRHSVEAPRLVEFAEAGSSYHQLELASHLLLHSYESDRAVEALKWIVLATMTKEGLAQTVSGGFEKNLLNLLMPALNNADADRAWKLASDWQERKTEKYEAGETDDMAAEYKSYLGKISFVIN